MLDARALFGRDDLPAWLRELLEVEAPWEVLAQVDAFLAAHAARRLEGEIHPTAVVEGAVTVEQGARVGPGAWLQGPVWIASGAEVGHAAVVRGGALVASGVKVGHASEVKRSLLLPEAKAPHFNYVGDSVLGARANLGAGVKLANLKNDGGEIRVDGTRTGLRKFGAAVGDDVGIGCNAVLQPGTVIGARSLVYAGTVVRGVVAPDTVVKLRQPLDHGPRT